MKKEIVMWLIIAVLVVGLLLGTQKAETMGVKVTGATSWVNYGQLSTDLAAATQKTIISWVNISSAATAINKPFYVVDIEGAVLTTSFCFHKYTTENNIEFAKGYATTQGIWQTNEVLSLDTWYLLAVSYDESNINNDPVFYINGVAQSIDFEQAPIGSLQSDTSDSIYSPLVGAATTPYGTVSGTRIFNRILTADEVLQIYNGRGRDNIHNGEVFCPFDKGAAGLQAFDGATLAAGNTIVDPCSGAVGVPAGSPVGVGETYLR